MTVQYTCPACAAKMRTAQAVPPGKSIKCPKCGQLFAPVAAAQGAAQGVAQGAVAAKPPEVFKLADDPPPASPAPPPRLADEEETGRPKAYGVVIESEEELKKYDKNKPKFNIEDKFKRSFRGPAQAMLVAPSNLLMVQGLLTATVAIFIFIVGMWPLVFNEAPPSDEEWEEAIITMILALLAFGWAALIFIGASEMQQVGSYTWALVGSIAGLLPMLGGLLGLIMLFDKDVRQGFEESESGLVNEDDEEEDEEDEEDED